MLEIGLKLPNVEGLWVLCHFATILKFQLVVEPQG
jgi:hypothetical protein